MLEVVILELKGWAEEDNDDNNGEGDNELLSGAGDGDGDGEHEHEHIVEPPSNNNDDLLFEPTKKLSKDDKAIRDQLDVTIKNLDFIELIYQPIIKRRLKRFPAPSPTLSQRPTSPGPAPSSPSSAAPRKVPRSQSASNEPYNPSNTATTDPATTDPTIVDRLDEMMRYLQELQSETDELAAALYELDRDHATQLLYRCVHLAGRVGTLAEFTAWVRKWRPWLV